MRDGDCVRFLQWALPRLGFRWAGFRRVRRQVCRRLAGRLADLGLADLDAYRRRLEADAGEWRRLAPLCRVTISRFFRDRGLYRALGEVVLPALAARRGRGARLAVWSAGCGAGEEPYSVAMVARRSEALAGCTLRVAATDWDLRQLARAACAVYPESSLRDLPPGWREQAFEPLAGGDWRLRPAERYGVAFAAGDLRRAALAGPFDLVLCRNAAFTYFDRRLQQRVLDGLVARLRPGGALAVGSHERPPIGASELAPWPGLGHLWLRGD